MKNLSLALCLLNSKTLRDKIRSSTQKANREMNALKHGLLPQPGTHDYRKCYYS